ncbi:pre-mRNA-processing protein 40A [Citrus sinensis]|uniref:Pre-mRNA-processing protein 40A n=1 Tax=Citrus sinensis TaxID=2711 RepID=A0ACB8IDF4_CITSI|nr:pre-mRNA-processing protein 40A [Citrus sinensis]
MAEMANNAPYSGAQVPHQPPMVGSMDPPRGFGPPIPSQYRPLVPAPQPQHYVPMASQHFQPGGQGGLIMNAGFPSQPLQPPFRPLMHPLPARPGPPAPSHVPPPPQVMSLPNAQPSNHIPPSSLPRPNVQALSSYPPGLGGLGRPVAASYTFAPSSYGQPQLIGNVNIGSQQPMSQMHVPSISAGGQLGVSVSQSTVSSTPVQPTDEQMAATTASAPLPTLQPKSAEGVQTDWKEHTSADGRRFAIAIAPAVNRIPLYFLRYYFNKRTRVSTWDKPFELMTTIERADASTDWKEFTSPDGRKYYYNKVTKQSKWSLPDELKLAREQAEKASIKGTQSETSPNSQTPISFPSSVVKAPSSADISSSTVEVIASSPVAVVPIIAASETQPALVSVPSTSPVITSSVVANADGVPKTVDAIAPMIDVSSSIGEAVTDNTVAEAKNNLSNMSASDLVGASDKVPPPVTEETRKDAVRGEKVSDALEEKTVEQEHFAYANKLEAKNAFKALLESANVGSDWTWDQALRAIINDRRYGALRTLGERKTAFNEYLGQKKKQDAEERRLKLKKARDDYKKMLEESVELTSSTRWSKAVTMFENDERFKALERERDRKDMFDDHLDELKQKERAKVQEERKRNIIEYRKFLESCDFIKANTQWRKVQDRLEADERCSRLDKMDRLEIFQEYLNDLEKEEEEQRKIQKEELSKTERKNRDEFRKLMEADVALGTLTAKTNWRDYCIKVKDSPPYMAVASNTSGSTPKDLFEDVVEELQKQFQEDKTRIKDAVKLRKITLSSTWTFEDFKASVLEDATSPPISDVNLKLIFDDLLIKVKEKEEKEAKKRKRLEDEFFDLLCSVKEISATSTWENCRQLLEGSQEFSSIGDESICRGVFDEFVTQLKEQAKDYERKRKEEKAKREKEREERDRRKLKQGRDKERAREREKEDHSKKDGADSDHDDSAENDSKRSGKDNDKKHRKRHQSAHDSLDENEKDRSKNPHRHNSDRKKPRRLASTPESENESRHKRHRRDNRNGSRKNGDHEDLEDGEYGGESR